MILRLLLLGITLFVGTAGMIGCSGGATEEATKPFVDPAQDPTIPQNPPEGGMAP